MGTIIKLGYAPSASSPGGFFFFFPRLSFSTLGEAKDYDGNGKFRWGATLLIPGDSPEVAAVRAIIQKEAEAKWGKKADSYLDEILRDRKASCWIDGNKREYNGYEGNWALTAYRYVADGRPLVLDNDQSPIYDQKTGALNPGKAGRLTDGFYVRAEVEIYIQDSKNGRGVRAGLLQIQRARKGDSFGGASAPVAGSLGVIEDDEDEESLG